VHLQHDQGRGCKKFLFIIIMLKFIVENHLFLTYNYHKKVLYVYEKPDNDRIKLLVLYCGEEDDIKLNMAASGALAQFTEQSEKICQRVLDVPAFYSTFKQCACVQDIELQFRIFYILRNIVVRNKEMCTRIVQSELMEVIVALTRIDIEKERLKVKELADEIVRTTLEHGLIKPSIASFDDVRKDDEDD
jgi:hypothetical protein